VPRVLRPIGHDDRLSVTDHLDELRRRLFVCLAALVVAFTFSFVENHHILHALNRALPTPSKAAADHISGLTGDSARAAKQLSAMAGNFTTLSQSKGVSAADRATYSALAAHAEAAAKALPQEAPKQVPITIGVGEPFSVTLTVCFYFSLVLALPILLYELYAFIIPALHPTERRAALPAMLAAPLLFVIGAVFAYFVVMPPAVKFLQGYNSQNFNNLVQAKPLYTFEVLTMLGIGLAFQLPLGLLALQRAGVITARTLTRHWRYATVGIAVIAAAMPGADPVTTGLETLPLVILFLASILMLKFADRRDAARAAAELDAEMEMTLGSDGSEGLED
jgi:sec-independent protein translocase protein TatC